MSDEEFNSCESLALQWKMQRLLTLLRAVQPHCTDTECFSISRLPGPSVTSTPYNNQVDFLMIFMIIGVATLLYMFRPSSMRASQTSTKLHEIANSNNDPPGPPPATN